VTIEPLVFERLASRLSFKFLLSAILIGTRELTSGISNPSATASIVDLTEGKGLN